MTPERKGLIREIARGGYERLHAMPPWGSLTEDEIAPLLDQAEGSLLAAEAFNGGCRVVPVDQTYGMTLAVFAADNKSAIENYGSPADADVHWSVMLAASPYAPSSNDEQPKVGSVLSKIGAGPPVARHQSNDDPQQDQTK